MSLNKLNHTVSSTQSVVSRLTISVSPGNLLGMSIHRPTPDLLNQDL